MPRDLPISNGNLMINVDHDYNIRDVDYPHIGAERMNELARSPVQAEITV